MCRARSCACVRRGLVGSEHARGVGRAACWERRLVWATGCAWRPLSSPWSSSSKARHPPCGHLSGRPEPRGRSWDLCEGPGRARSLRPPRPPLLSLCSPERRGPGLRGALRALCGCGPTASGVGGGAGTGGKGRRPKCLFSPFLLLRALRRRAAEAMSWAGRRVPDQGFV